MAGPRDRGRRGRHLLPLPRAGYLTLRNGYRQSPDAMNPAQ
jgi:hypothetical protein